jgi:hypothetical protein
VGYGVPSLTAHLDLTDEEVVSGEGGWFLRRGGGGVVAVVFFLRERTVHVGRVIKYFLNK